MHERTISTLKGWIEDNEGTLKYQQEQLRRKVDELTDLKKRIDEISAKIQEYKDTLACLEKANSGVA